MEWVRMFEGGDSALAIAGKVGADPGTVSSWLKKHGVIVYQGLHRVERRPPSIPSDLAELLARGPLEASKFVTDRVWGINVTEEGINQLTKFCNLLNLDPSLGLEAAARMIEVDRSVASKWIDGSTLPYLVRVAQEALSLPYREGWKILPLRVDSGGNALASWIRVPSPIVEYSDVSSLVSQLVPTESAYIRGEAFGISRMQTDGMRHELFAYLLGMMAGDASKSGGKQKRLDSMSIDLQLTSKQPTNERLGEFVCFCANALGLEMDRRKDKQPSGTTSRSRHPSAAFRWNSERSPLFAWMFNVALGIPWGGCTTLSPLQISWLVGAPFEFRKRFIQALADSDGCVKKYVVEITSVPNADLITELLHSLGLKSAYTRTEKGIKLRSVVRAVEAAEIPILNELVHSYRYDKLLRYKRGPA